MSIDIVSGQVAGRDLQTQPKTIEVYRLPWGDAAKIVGEIARKEGVKIVSSIRWRGALAPTYRDVALSDGREIRVYER